jgi:hypothetical protein
MKMLLTLGLVVIVLIAGCTGPLIVPDHSNFGLEMTSFSVDNLTAVYSGNTVRVIMEVENRGGSIVDKLTSKAFVYLTGSDMDLETDQTMYWRGKASADQSSCKQFTKDMLPEDVVKGAEGTTTAFRWDLLAPAVNASQIRSDTFIGRVYYDYQTSVTGTVWVYSQSESDAAKASGRTLNKATLSSTSGPVAMTVKTSPDPVVLSSGENSFTVMIKLSNVGGGVLYKAGSVDCSTGNENIALTTDQLNKVDVSVTSPGMTFTGCTGEQELALGKDITLSCDAIIATAPATFQGFPITVTAVYGYNAERTATVEVSGR